ncbi:MAG: carbamate kinase [Thermovirgaceae bacterium]|jgi:carbamate kinase|nr:carbamate kinase [Synergistales bacterium]MDI9393177.1 carbamate kinase [Synergistota bacterium]MDY0178577.1 carbamate kinase [Synergistaceae bacterium]HRW87575.1 carbamate kinase [Thermovirgaceae bacterium]MDD3134308.1 carbamate kinase [Synergistales bacterium]
MDRPTKVVIALGGNALQEAGTPPTAEAQLEVVRRTAEYLAEISCRNYEMAIVHGNGPQVGRIVLSQEIASKVNEQTPAMPFDVCGSMSQGYIGYHIQQALRDALRNRNRNLPVVTLVTQVVVDPKDPAFKNPTKPIGQFYSGEEAKKIAEEKGYVMKEDAGRGWRRVVPSPEPKRIVEISAVKRLWDTTIVITAGGGGIPVIENMDGSLTGVAAVIDKDLAAEKLAQDIEADILLILTEIDKVCLNFKKPNQQFLDHMTVPEAIRYMEEGHFAPGSMLPKVLAAVKFARTYPGKKAIITSLYKAVDALEGKEGTIVTMA